MRETKYQAWDKRDKKMYMDVHLQYDGHPHCLNERSFGEIINAPIEDEYPFSGEKRFALREYTGLKDKNGVEIYEGDIVHKNEHETWVVEFGEGRFYVFNGLNSERDLDHDYNHTYDDCPIVIVTEEIDFHPEVIGNIYDNPELLEKDQ